VAVFRSLQAFDHSYSQASGQVGVFTVGFLSTTPAWIPEYVDIGCPERQVLVLATTTFHLLAVSGFGPGFITDGGKGSEDSVLVKGGCHADSLGKDGGIAATSHSVQGFVPPAELGYSKPGYWSRLVLHEGYFFFQGETTKEVLGTLFVR